MKKAAKIIYPFTCVVLVIVTMFATINNVEARQCSATACTGGTNNIRVCDGTNTGDYEDLRDAIAAVNGATFSGNIVITIRADCAVEATTTGNTGDDPAILTRTSHTSIKIISDAGGPYTISDETDDSAGDACLIINNSDNVCIEGVNFTNNSTDANAGGAITIRNGVTNFSMYDCTLTAARTIVSGTTTSVRGVFSILSTATTNDPCSNITVDGCTIVGDRSDVQYGIYSVSASTTGTNSNNNTATIRDCTIKDYFNAAPSSGLKTTCGIYLGAKNNAWTIDGNSFTMSSSVSHTTTQVVHAPIRIDSGVGYTITGNNIGGNGSGGSYVVTRSSTNTPTFIGIYVNGGGSAETDLLATVTGNTISNITFTTSQTYNFDVANQDHGVFTGILVGRHNDISGDAAVGSIDISGNTVGGSISITGGASAEAVGMFIDIGGQVDIDNSTASNIVQGISITSSTTTTDSNVAGVRVYGNGTINVTNVLVNNLTASTVGNGQEGVFAGIEIDGTGSHTVSNNTVSNLTINGTATNGSTNASSGIQLSNGSNICEGNSIFNLSVPSDVGVGLRAGVSELTMLALSCSASGTNSIRNNTIYGISNTNTGSFGVFVGAIYVDNGTTTVEFNKIYNITNNSTHGTESRSIGIMRNTTSGAVTIRNNAISMATNNSVLVTPIFDDDGASNSIYNNSIYISGSAAGATSTGIFRNGTAAGNVANNLVWNNASAGTRSCINSSTGSDYNTLIQQGSTPTNQGNYGWAVATGSTHGPSTTATDLFLNVTDPTSANFLRIDATKSFAWLINGKGNQLLSVTDDIDGSARSTTLAGGPIDIGADEVTVDIATNPPPMATPSVVGTPTAGTTTTYTYANNTWFSIAWRTGFPTTAVTVQYYSGENPVSPPSVAYGHSFWRVTPSGTNTGLMYNATMNYGPHEIGTIPGVKALGKYNGSWISYLNDACSTDGKSCFTEASNPHSITGYGYTSFSDFAKLENTTLPISLSHFSAKPAGRSVVVEWVTEVEEYNEYFNVERSTNGKDFQSIVQVPGAVFSRERLSYSHYDDEPLPGASYYRLKQTDTDGSFSYSKVVLVNRDAEGSINMLAYPNPSTGKLTLEFSEKGGQVQIYNLLGQLVHSSTAQERTVEVTLKDRGIYNIQYLHQAGKDTQKVIIE